MIQLSTNQTENLKAACYHAAKEVGNRTSRVNDVYLMQGYDSNNGAPGFTVATERPHRFSWLVASARWSKSKGDYVFVTNEFLTGEVKQVADRALGIGLVVGVAEYEAEVTPIIQGEDVKGLGSAYFKTERGAHLWAESQGPALKVLGVADIHPYAYASTAVGEACEKIGFDGIAWRVAYEYAPCPDEAYGETHGSDEQFMLEQQEAKDAQEVSE